MDKIERRSGSVLASIVGATLVTTSLAVVHPASASRGGQVNKSAAQTSVHNASSNRNTNVNRNSNVSRNTNVNVNRNVNVNSGYGGGGYDRWGHPIATGVAIGATAAVTSAAVGSMVNTLPSGCIASGPYQNCGGTYYQPQYQGSSVAYVVVNPP
ncbi:MAG: hypothetical protein WBY94_11390 [Polyangiaceae bacterium]